MYRALWLTVSDRAAGCRQPVLWLLAALAASGCGAEPKISFTSVSDPPTVQADPTAGPEDRPGRRAAEFRSSLRAYVDLCEAPLLYRKMDRGHRRQGQEERRTRHALHARAGRGIPDEEGGCRGREGADRSGPEDGGRGQGQRRSGRGTPRRGEGDPRQVSGRGRPLGHGGQAAHDSRSKDRSSPPRFSSSQPIS